MTVADKDNKNIVNSTTAGDVKHIKVYKVAELANWTYDDEALGAEWKTILEDLKNFPRWSTAEVDASSADGKTVANTANGLLVRNCYLAGTNTVAADGWSGTPGVYDVVLEVNAAATGYKLGGTITVRLTVIKDVLNADASVTVAYKGEVVTSVEKDFDGTPISAGDFAVKLWDEDGNQISDTTLKATLVDSEGRTVTSATNAGNYKFVLSSTNYELTGTTEVPVTINKIDLSSIHSALGMVSGGADYIYTQARALSLKGLKLEYLAHEDADGDGKLDCKALPSAIYDTEHVKIEMLDEKTGEWTDITKRTDKFTKEGQYRISVFPHTEVEYGNYVFATDEGTTVEYRVVNSNKFMFDDVSLSYWGFDTIYEVAKKGTEYMNGYSGTKLFGPNDSITRGQVACVLFNMATAAGSVDETGLSYNEMFGYETGFDDVNGKAYYGQAFAWAKQAGVVNGYGDGTFKPDAAVIREEFAAMLANYAKKVGDFETVDTDEVLASMPDGNKVSDWAKDVVAWAVDAEVMGNGGVINPSSAITRGKAAGMVYNFDLA